MKNPDDAAAALQAALDHAAAHGSGHLDVDGDDIAALLQERAQSRPVTAELMQADTPTLLCKQCIIEQHVGQRTDTNAAYTIVGGDASCREHLVFRSKLAIPGALG